MDATLSPPTLAHPWRVAALTAAALIGFAANSLLCRLALAPGAAGGPSIDAASFTAVRLVSGAAMLALLAWATGMRDWLRSGSWASAAALFAYALAFSLAYLRIGAGPGALLLFGAVQMTMIGWGLSSGERPGAWEWLGIALAFGGLGGLTLRGATAPDSLGAGLMVLAGIAWGIYSIRGRGSRRALGATAGNFARALPLALLSSLVLRGALHLSPRGALLAAASGALASGVGYSFWYAALPHLTATRAAVVQLAAPVVAAVGAVLLLGEPASPRLLGAGAAIIGGVALTVLARTR